MAYFVSASRNVNTIPAFEVVNDGLTSEIRLILVLVNLPEHSNTASRCKQQNHLVLRDEANLLSM